MANTRLAGALTAIVTPFNQDQSIDEKTLRMLVDRQVEAGISGIIACGTTGEAAALSLEEHQKVVSIIVDQVGQKIPVVAGAGANSTQRAIELSKACQDAGADSLLHIAPGYIKPTQRGILQHFDAIVSEVDLPVLIYNVPGRTAVTISPETILEMAQNPIFIGVKQAVTDLTQVWQILEGRPEGFAVLSGEDFLTLPMIALGADGVVSVIGNQFPKELVEMCRAGINGNRELSVEYHARLAPLMAANFVESNPIPAKFVMAEMGLLKNVLRTPMTPLAAEYQSDVSRALWQAKQNQPNPSPETALA